MCVRCEGEYRVAVMSESSERERREERAAGPGGEREQRRRWRQAAMTDEREEDHFSGFSDEVFSFFLADSRWR